MGVIISCNWGPLDKLMRLSGIACGAVLESKVRFLSAALVRTLGSGALGGPTCAPHPAPQALFPGGAPGMGCFFYRRQTTPAILSQAKC